ncbi:MAG TPA: substrate-binding domain-containing protein [Mycobacteriales bacterium]|nr:substrate-binding domain-containing protein [Mycobacteriales bacterium]HWC34210.1 substrate-binding domain-containing protein [Mycobacteriales bacterium]
MKGNSFNMKRKLFASCSALVVAGFASSFGAAAPASASGSHALVEGSGSSWSANAVNQWIADVHSNGLQVVYNPTGSAQGRVDFANKTVDFSVSDIPYQGVDPVTHASDTSQGRAYSYLPIVAGGTSFPYQLRVNGELVRNLRLSGTTIAKIFTNQITNWDDPAITQDNNGRKFPDLPIIPVVHSEGSGDTAQFTTWLATDYQSIWQPFGGPTYTEYFPRQGAQVAENGSDSVMNFITSAAANGSIGYNEYSYALGADYPVAKLLNKAGYYTLPNQYNVAVALTKAKINYDKSNPQTYLTQKLDQVYVNPEPQTYPLSSYSYLILPTASNDARMTTAKRQTIADYLYYAICQGQKEMGPIGYSPLPINLVQAGFQQIAKLHTADNGVNLTQENVSTCNNPTFIAGHPTENYLAKIAPKPAACDKEGAGPCTTEVDQELGNPSGGHPTSTKGSGAGGSKSASGGKSPTTSGSSPPTATGGSNQSGGSVPLPTGTSAASGGVVDPGTGAVTDTAATTGTVSATATTVAASPGHGLDVVLGVIAALLLVVLLVVPPLVWQRFGGSREA